MFRGIAKIVTATVLLTGCAVSANEFEPATLAPVEAPSITIDERYRVQVSNQSALSLRATVLGTTCSAVGVSGDFQQRFDQILDRALSGIFVGGPQSGETSVSITITPETPRLRMLRRGYMNGDARIDFAMAADVVVVRAGGDREEIHITADTTRVQTAENTMSCDGAARSLGTAFDESATQLAAQLRQAIITPE